MPDRVFEEAGKLAGYYSSGRDSDKLEIDYLQKKNVKNRPEVHPDLSYTIRTTLSRFIRTSAA